MLIHVERKDLINPQQMEVVVNGPDGATHLILCTGIANLCTDCHETYTFPVGPQLSRRQFVGTIVSGALSRIQVYSKDHVEYDVQEGMGASIVSMEADFDEEFGQVRVRAKISFSRAVEKLAISYNVSILAELPGF